MGYYINHTSNGPIGASFSDKVHHLTEDGAIPISPPTSFQNNLVCVVDNGFFGAAAYCYDENEYQVLIKNDGRPKTWFLWDKVAHFAK